MLFNEHLQWLCSWAIATRRSLPGQAVPPLLLTGLQSERVMPQTLEKGHAGSDAPVSL